MRRSDKEVTSPREIAEILTRAEVCRLALNDGGYPYIVPMNFGFGDPEEGEREGEKALFFHSALQGKKIDLLRRDPRVAFEVDVDTELVTSEEACSFTMRYRSVCGRGRVRFLEDDEAKRRALNRIMGHYTGKGDWDFPEKMLKAIAVFVLEIEEISAKKS